MTLDTSDENTVLNLPHSVQNCIGELCYALFTLFEDEDSAKFTSIDPHIQLFLLNSTITTTTSTATTTTPTAITATTLVLSHRKASHLHVVTTTKAIIPLDHPKVDAVSAVSEFICNQ